MRYRFPCIGADLRYLVLSQTPVPHYKTMDTG